MVQKSPQAQGQMRPTQKLFLEGLFQVLVEVQEGIREGRPVSAGQLTLLNLFTQAVLVWSGQELTMDLIRVSPQLESYLRETPEKGWFAAKLRGD